MNQRIVLWAWSGFVLGGLVLCGCSTQHYGVVKKDGIYFHRYNYRVKNTYRSSRSVFSSAWVFDNFHRDEEGEWVMNKGRRYWGISKIDRDGDGKLEDDYTYFFDLKLNHSSSNAVIWIQNQELATKSARKSLSTLLSNYAESLTGAGFYAEANIFSLQMVKQKRYVATVLQKKRVTVGGKPALTARIRIVNLDRLKVDPKHTGDTIQVTLLKVYYHYEAPRTSAYGGLLRGYSVMIVGYYNATQAFPKLFSDYRRLLSLVEFGPRRGSQ